MASEVSESPRKRIKLEDSAQPASSEIESANPVPQASKISAWKDQVMSQDDQERAVGITAFVSSDAPSFQCIVKQRYTDFLVNEISLNGVVVRLTDLDHPSGSNENRARLDGSVKASSSNNGSGTKSPPKEKPHADDTTSIEAVPHEEQQPVSDTTNVSAQNSSENSLPAETSNGQDSSQISKQEILLSIPNDDRTTLQNIFGEQTTGQILDLYANVMLHPLRKARDQPHVQSDVISEKSKRTEAHVAIRRIFTSRLETSTIQDSPGVISIKAAPPKGPSGARGKPSGARGKPSGENTNGAYQKGKLGWSELGGEHLHFTLYKENKDTMEVLYAIASQLKVPAKSFQFAGTKDRRAVTVQRVSIFRIYADRIAKLNRTARGWRVGNFEYKKHGLDLGELGGNEFLLTLRDCRFNTKGDLTHEQKLAFAKIFASEATEAFASQGFLNYYGLQRFGTFSTGTHMTGQRMLKGDLEGAVDSILTYSENLLPENQDDSGSQKVPQDDINRADAIRIWRKTGEAKEALSKMPKRFQAEAAIILYLSKKDKKTGRFLQDRDWQGALMQIQRNLRLMYVHAYQSLVWNTVSSKRWEQYGSKVVEGDLVIVGEKDGDKQPAKDDVDEDGEPVFHPAADDSAPSGDDTFTRARPLSASEAVSGKYDIFDVVLPLPGFDVEYPPNETGKFYETFMGSEAGGGLDPHKMHRGWKDISLPGSYRKIMAKPGNDVKIDVHEYVQDEEQLVQTDFERIKKEKNGQADPAATEMNGSGITDENKKIALVLKMQLGSSQYATMALRELTKGGAMNFKPEYSVR